MLVGRAASFLGGPSGADGADQHVGEGCQWPARLCSTALPLAQLVSWLMSAACRNRQLALELYLASGLAPCIVVVYACGMVYLLL